MAPRLTTQALTILAVLDGDPLAERHGFDLSDQTGIKTGTLYPLLARFEQAGWLTSRWEEIDPRVAGRPRRRLYALTPHGVTATRHALESHLQALSVPDRPVHHRGREWGIA